MFNLPDFHVEHAVTTFFLGIGIFVAFKIFSFFKELLNAKRKYEIQEIDYQKKAIKDHHDRMATQSLIDEANKRSGHNTDPKKPN